MLQRKRAWIDALAAGGLAFVLLVVFLIDRLTPVAGRSSHTGDLVVNIVSDAAPRQGSTRLKIALTPTHRSVINGREEAWDDMAKLLTQLGSGYQFDILTTQAIAANPKLLDGYDVLFLTCAPGGEELRNVLPGFVARGGTLYASDWRFGAVAAAFPEMVDRNAVASGTPQQVLAEVVDPSLRDVLGVNAIRLQFDLTQWKVAGFGGPRVTPILRGAYRKERFQNDQQGVPAFGNFLVRFQHGKGTVIFTSFHNEKQNSDLEIKLLQHLVFQLVNATADADITQRNEQAGFEPSKSNLLSAPRGNPTVTRTYTHTKAGPLRVSLGFRSEGAKLGLDLVAPDGKGYHWEGEGSVILEAPYAAAGEWTATVTALQLPYENFPFSVTFGAKK